MTLLELIKRIAANFHYYSGTATGGSDSTVVDTTLLEPDDFWNNHYVYITSADSAAPEGEERYVSDYDQSSQTLTATPNFSAAVAAGDEYVLLQFRRADFIVAIRSGIARANSRWLVPVTDTTTVQIATDTYSYSLPTDVVRIDRILYRDDSSDPWLEVDPGSWRMSGVPGSQKLELTNIDAFDSGDYLRVEYVKRQSDLSNDSDELGVGEPAEPELVQFLVEHAMFRLHTMAMSRNVTSSEFRAHMTLADDYYKRSEDLLTRSPGQRLSSRLRLNRDSISRG